MEEKITLMVKKKADKDKNRIVLPQQCIEKFGRVYDFEMYETYIKLVPNKSEEK